jgi:hypothetical protein
VLVPPNCALLTVNDLSKTSVSLRLCV